MEDLIWSSGDECLPHHRVFPKTLNQQRHKEDLDDDSGEDSDEPGEATFTEAFRDAARKANWTPDGGLIFEQPAAPDGAQLPHRSEDS